MELVEDVQEHDILVIAVRYFHGYIGELVSPGGINLIGRRKAINVVALSIQATSEFDDLIFNERFDRSLIEVRSTTSA
ncbi:hypothetical protein H0H87_003039 [Tephrocybe sp. NHM501043]|nr:hypothetical protein H0H87_003039 [Tephrocybe sp. NHM501043]